jgi:hypothetical protein
MWSEEDQEMPPTELPHALATRFVALDVHRQDLVGGAVDLQQHVVLTPRRFGCAAKALVGESPCNPCRCSRAGSDCQCVAAV